MHEQYGLFLASFLYLPSVGEGVASIHRESKKGSSRKVGFRQITFSETQVERRAGRVSTPQRCTKAQVALSATTSPAVNAAAGSAACRPEVKHALRDADG